MSRPDPDDPKLAALAPPGTGMGPCVALGFSGRLGAALRGLSHEIELQVAFYDLDPMDIVWHGHYVKYLELARCALLERFDYGYAQMRASGYVWPVVDMRLKYVRSASYGQRIKVRAEITEWESRLRIDYLLRDAASGERLNKAYTIQVAVDMQSREMQYVCPPVLLERLGLAP